MKQMKTEAQLRELVRYICDELDELREQLQEEQDDSQEEIDEWNEESGDLEPKLVDHQEQINRLESAYGHLDNAMEELNR